MPGGVDVLNSHMFLNIKSNGILKARLVAGGNKMDKCIYDKMSRSSPTVHLENVFILLGYTTTNSMNICSLDVEGAFLEVGLPDPIYLEAR